MIRTFGGDDRVLVACTCGKKDCFSPARAPKEGRFYDYSNGNRVFIDFWDTIGPNPDDSDDSRTYEFSAKCVTKFAGEPCSTRAEGK